MLKHKEHEAQLQRAEALKHLEKQGQHIGKPNISSARNNSQRGDNTLDLLIKQKLVEQTRSSSTGKVSDLERRSKSLLMQQQSNTGTSVCSAKNSDSYTLPPFWKEICDSRYGKPYYWNTESNETSWEKPLEVNKRKAETLSTSEETTDLPAGWAEKTHPATKQTYFFNSETGQSSFEHPCVSSLIASNDKSLKGSDHKAKVSSSSTIQAKKQRVDIDPLDPTNSNNGKWSSGLHCSSDKMADSTASGPLWQQRPYPAPGSIMRKKSTDASSLGPGYP